MRLRSLSFIPDLPHPLLSLGERFSRLTSSLRLAEMVIISCLALEDNDAGLIGRTPKAIPLPTLNLFRERGLALKTEAATFCHCGRKFAFFVRALARRNVFRNLSIVARVSLLSEKRRRPFNRLNVSWCSVRAASSKRLSGSLRPLLPYLARLESGAICDALLRCISEDVGCAI